MVTTSQFFNPDAEEFVPIAEEEYRHSGGRDEYSLGRGEAGHREGKQSEHPDSEDESVGVGMCLHD